MAIRGILWAGLLAAAPLVQGCAEEEGGPIQVSAIGSAPRLANPNLVPLDPPSAFFTEAVAQGLVRFDAAGQIEPALAQSWIVSNDGLRYTFRIAPAEWASGGRVTAQQVVERLQATISRSSRNPLRPVLGAIEEIVAMTDEVLEISLKAPRPNFLQLLAQPEMGLLRARAGSGPYRFAEEGGAILLQDPLGEEERDEAAAEPLQPIVLRGEPAALAIARFDEGLADLVLGGTAGELPLARAAAPPAGTLIFDPAAGLFGLAFTGSEGPLLNPLARHALSMAIDRAGLVAALGVPGLQPRETLLPQGLEEQPQPTLPDWAANPLPARRAMAVRLLEPIAMGQAIGIRVSMPQAPGYSLIFAHLKRDWRAIGVLAERVAPGDPADLVLVDRIAPAQLATWYLRRFACDANPLCDPAADEMLEAARLAPSPATRRGLIANADRILTGLAPFIAITAPVRWSLVSPRLTGFRANPFGRHPAGELVAEGS